MTGKFDAQQEVTDRIIAAIEAGTPPWRKPWTGDRGGAAFPLRACGEPYRGINVILLWLEADAKGYASPHWFTYRQAQELGAQVRKGEKSVPVRRVRHLRHRKGRASGRGCRDTQGDVHQALPCLQRRPDRRTGGKLLSTAGAGPRPRDRAGRRAGDLLAATGAVIETSDDPRAYYNPVVDRIRHPHRSGPSSPRAPTTRPWPTRRRTGPGTATGLTARSSPTGRPMPSRSSSPSSATSSSAPTSASRRISSRAPRQFESWLKALKEDKRAIFRAAAEGQKAADLLLALAGDDEKETAGVAAPCPTRKFGAPSAPEIRVRRSAGFGIGVSRRIAIGY